MGPDLGLIKVRGDGGPSQALTHPDTAAGELGYWAPDALPGGRAVIFTSYRHPTSRIDAIDLEGS
jgi:hypothetical protein